LTDKLKIVCRGWKPFERNTLKGFAVIYLPVLRLTIEGVAIHEKSDRRWAQLPARPQLDEQRQLVRDDAGKIKYAPIMSFDSREVGDAFSAAVVAAIQDFELGITGADDLAFQ